MPVRIEKIYYLGWPNCIRLANDTVELIVTTDIGPRIIRFGLVGQGNEFYEWPGQTGLLGGDEWRCYGGSRLWHGPEIGKRCYEPDNAPVAWEPVENGIVLIQEIEPVSRIQKRIRISLDPDMSKVQIDYQIENMGVWLADLCIWALTLMQPGGLQIIPLVPPVLDIVPNGVLPSGGLIWWPYTNLVDNRLSFLDDCILIRQDLGIQQPFKIGLPVEAGWGAYLNKNHLFIKQFAFLSGRQYPDHCSSWETFTNGDFLEMETLSPMQVLKPGDILTHQEIWYLFECPLASVESNQLRKFVETLIPR